MKYVCVPQDATKEIAAELEGWSAYRAPGRDTNGIEGWQCALAARPPLPDDIEAALELARQYDNEPREGAPYSVSDRALLARALLKACGRGEE